MSTLELFLYPNFILYVSMLFSSLLLPCLGMRKWRLSSVFLLFGLLAFLLATYSFSFSGEKSVIMLALSGLTWFVPFLKGNRSLLRVRSMYYTDVPEDIQSMIVESLMRKRKWGSYCYKSNRKTFKVTSRFFETKIKISGTDIYVDTTISSLLDNVINIVSLFLIGYTTYLLYAKLAETEIVSLASSLTVTTILLVVLLGILFNISGFLQENHKEIYMHILAENRKLKKAEEISQAIKIAKKIKKTREEGEKLTGKEENNQ